MIDETFVIVMLVILEYKLTVESVKLNPCYLPRGVSVLTVGRMGGSHDTTLR